MIDNDAKRRWGLEISRADLDDEVAEELAFHLEQRTRKLIDGGLDERSAREEAQRRFGSVRTVQAECLDLSEQTQRRQLRLQALSEFWQDARYSLRSLRRRPSFALSAILTLAIGIGATTGVYSLLDAVLLRSLPYPEPERLVSVWSWGAPESHLMGFSSLDEFENVAGYSVGDSTLTGVGEPARLSSAQVSPSFFATLRANPLRGRAFIPSDGESDAPAVAILSEEFWRQRLEGDPSVLDRTIELDGVPHSVVGVMPAALDLPSGDTQVWTPIQVGSPSSGNYWGSSYLLLFARLAEGVEAEQALTALRTRAEQLRLENPIWRPNEEWIEAAQVEPFQSALAGGLRGLLLLLFGAVLAVLLVVCVNVGSLFLSRATAKQHETAIRSSMGAGRGRLLRQSMVEAWLVALSGTALGLSLALMLMRWLQSRVPGFDGQFGAVGIDGRILGFALLLSLVTTVLFGSVPALRFTRQTDLPEALRSSRGATSKGSASAALVVAQLALSALLLTAAGVLLAGFRQQLNTETGMDVERVVAAQLSPPNALYTDQEERVRLYQRVLEALDRDPTVESVAASSTLPFGSTFRTAFDAPDRNFDPNALPFGSYRHITPGYFRTVGIPILRGRDLDASDALREEGCTKNAPCAALVDDRLAQQVWPDEDALGRLIGAHWLGWFEIVGIAANSRLSVTTNDTNPMLYLPQNQMPQTALQVIVRTRASARDLATTITEAVRTADPQVPVTDIRSLTDDIWESAAKGRIATQLIGGFALTALLLAAIGVYGLMAYRGDQRRREMGIRLALGSTAQRLQQRELLTVGRLCAVGVLIGGIAVFCALRYFGASALLEGALGEFDIPRALWFAPPLTLTAVALLAGWFPARRSSRVDPLEALRTE